MKLRMSLMRVARRGTLGPPSEIVSSEKGFTLKMMSEKISLALMLSKMVQLDKR